MTSSSEWIHQADVDQAGDGILAESKATLATITAYQVAKVFDRSANSSLYAKFRDWRARRQAEATSAAATIDVPPEVEANIRAIFDRHNSEGIEACLNAVRTVGGNLDRVMTMRVTVAERRAEKAETETTEVLAIGEMTEEELRAATIRIAELETAVADGQRREDRLAGRIEQLEVELAVGLQDRPRDVAAAIDTLFGVKADDADDRDTSDAGDAGDTSDAGDAGAAAKTVSAPGRQISLELQSTDLDQGSDSDVSAE